MRNVYSHFVLHVGQIYGMDVSSGAAAIALDPQPYEHVLDLCAAPGGKMCLLADLMGRKGSVTGCDISPNRAAVCHKVLLKYGVYGGRTPESTCSCVNINNEWACRLFCADGTSFSVPPPKMSSSKEQSFNPKLSQRLLNNTERKPVDEKISLVCDTVLFGELYASFELPCNGRKRKREPSAHTTNCTEGCAPRRAPPLRVRKNKSFRSRERRRQQERLGEMLGSLDSTPAFAPVPTPVSLGAAPGAEDTAVAENTVVAELRIPCVLEGEQGAGETSPYWGGYHRVLVDAECSHDGSFRYTPNRPYTFLQV
jgi:hypothetical protein